MLETALHRRIALAIALAALALSGAVAGAPVTTAADVSPSVDASPSADVSPSADASITEADEVVADADPAVVSSDANVTIDHDGPLVLRSARNQSVRVRSDAPAGTEVMVTLRSARYNLLQSSEVTIGDDGTGTAAFDLGGVEPGVSFTVVPRNSDDRVEGVVVNESATVHRDATFAVSDPASDYAIRGQVMGFATELDVNLSVEGETHSETVTVGEGRTFTASYNLSSVSAGAEAAVEVGGTPRSVTPVVATDQSEDPTAYVLIEPRNATIRYPEETLLAHSAANQTVYGATNLRPGTELTVKAENDKLNSPSSFERTDNATVREDGTFVAELNLSDVEPGTNFTVDVGPGLAWMDGRVANESVTLPTVETTTSDDGDDDSVGELGVPGFGVPAALVALLGALLLARRNRT